MTTINIIGAGIGGLCTAIALQQKGFKVAVYEAAPALHPIGAGIIMASNAIQVADRLGIAADIKAAGIVLHRFGIANHRGEPLQLSDVLAIEKRFGQPSVSIHRGTLQQVLIQHLAPNTLFLGKKLVECTQTAAGVTLHFEDGTVANSDLLIGADGIRSTTRRLVFGEQPLRYSTHTCWRGIIQGKIAEPQHTLELWGRSPGKRVALIQVDDNRIYFYYTEKRQAGFKLSPAETMPYLMTALAEFPPLYADSVAKAEVDSIFHDDIYDLSPMPTWSKGRVLLVGDAAHATTPNLGQGGCQAVEDAWFLSAFLTQYADYKMAFEAFEKMRRPKVDFVVSVSDMIGKMSNLGGAVGYRLRNALLALTPNAVSERQFKKLFELDK